MTLVLLVWDMSLRSVPASLPAVVRTSSTPGDSHLSKMQEAQLLTNSTSITWKRVLEAFSYPSDTKCNLLACLLKEILEKPHTEPLLIWFGLFVLGKKSLFQ